jgi:hypothetical protein
MINYDSFGGPPRRGHGRTGRIALAAAAVAVAGVLAVLVMGHVITIGKPGGPRVTAAGPAGSPSPAAASAVTSPAQDLTLGACIDPTTSIVSSFAPASGADGSIVAGTPATCTNA